MHQARNGAVQILVGAAHLFDLVDGVQHGSVMLAAKLVANFGQRGGGQLLDDIHRNLARKRDRARIAPNLQILFTQIEVFANAFLNQVYGDALFLRRNCLRQPSKGDEFAMGLQFSLVIYDWDRLL
jgi:hypothetical protein